MPFIFPLAGTIIFLILMLFLATYALGGLLAAPWVPLWRRDVVRMLSLADVKQGEVVVDLGAGDARILTAAVKKFKAEAIGYEIALLPYCLGYIKIILLGLSRHVSLKYANFYQADLSQADVVTIFLSPQANKKLSKILKSKLRPKTRVISYVFSIPGWEPIKIDKPSEKEAAIYMYIT